MNDLKEERQHFAQIFIKTDFPAQLNISARLLQNINKLILGKGMLELKETQTSKTYRNRLRQVQRAKNLERL
jgi:hypothetical protein